MIRTSKYFLSLFAVIFASSCLFETRAQDLFADTYGGTGYEYAYSFVQTSDGGYIFCGPSDTSSAGLLDFWIVKLDASGNVSWQKTYGYSGDEVPNSIRQTTDGGYIVAGRTTSFDQTNQMDAWVIKLDGRGNRVWQKTFGKYGGYDAAYCAVQNGEGGYYVAGWTNSYGAGGFDFWVLKLDPDGALLWEKAIGGTSADTPYSCCLSADGGVVVAGGGTVGAGGYDFWFVKLDSSGNVVWQKAYGGTSSDLAMCVSPAADGGFIAAGRTESYGAGGVDFWVMKLDSSGGLEWQRTYGGSSTDWAFAVTQVAGGGYVVAGRTDSFGTGTDAWILKLNSTGGIEWQRNYGGAGFEYAYSASETGDGSYLIGGVIGSFGQGSYDAMILKIHPSCFTGGSCSYFAATAVSPVTPSPTISTTTKTTKNSTCSSNTTAPTSTAWTPVRAVQCAYPLPAGSDEVTITMTLSGDDPVLNWTAPAEACSVTGYGIYRGTLPFSSYDHQSVNCSVTDLTYTDSFSGAAQYYLVVPNNLYLEGSYGYYFDGTGSAERPAASAPCRPQCLLPCL